MDISKALQWRYNINPTKGHVDGIDGINAKRFALAKKCCASLESRQVFSAYKHSDFVDDNGVEIDGRLPIELKVEVGKREVHNLLIYAAKLWTL